MARSAKSRRPPVPEPANPVLDAMAAAGALVGRNPALVGGTTAFLVSLSFVSANALWYQPYSHPTAFFSTREIDRDALPPAPNETTIRIERQDAAPRQAPGDPTTKTVQAALKQLNFYDGTVDGLSGPNTRRAVEAYQRTAGLPITGTIDKSLLDQLDTGTTAGIVPTPKPKPAAEKPAQPKADQPVDARFEGDDGSEAGRIRKVQAALREFGRKDVDIDGRLGTRTRQAIVEFQTLFGMKATGAVDDALIARMRKEDYIN